jgi:peroxiredoxin (alkyl hydroperoxide reductase subunit C)
MISIGQTFPPFKLKATVSLDMDKAFTEISHHDYADKWLVVFSWPKDFTFVCPTEIAEFAKMNGEFEKRGAQILGFSVDNEYTHLAWRQQNPMLKNVPFPMMSDIKRELSRSLGIIDPEEGVAGRATFIVDPENIVRFAMMTDLSVGRSVKECLRILDALQTGELCACDWQSGEETLKTS